MIVFHFNDKYMSIKRVSQLLYLSDCDVIEGHFMNKIVPTIIEIYPDLVIISSENFPVVYKKISRLCESLGIKIMISEESFWTGRLENDLEVNHPLCFKANFNLNDVDRIRKEVNSKDIDIELPHPVKAKCFVDIEITQRNDLMFKILSENEICPSPGNIIEFKHGLAKFSSYIKEVNFDENSNSDNDKKTSEKILSRVGPVYKEIF